MCNTLALSHALKMFSEFQSLDVKISFQAHGKSEDAMGGWKKQGGWKPSRMTPLPKRGFGPPPRTVRFPPLSGVSALFFLYKNPRQSRPEALSEGSKDISGERVLWYVFPPPIRFAPPPISRPKQRGHLKIGPPSEYRSIQNYYPRNLYFFFRIN